MSYYSFQYSCVLTRFLVYKTASSEVFCFWSRTFQNQYAFKLTTRVLNVDCCQRSLTLQGIDWCLYIHLNNDIYCINSAFLSVIILCILRD